MLIRRIQPWHYTENQVTDEKVYLNRRQFLKTVAAGSVAASGQASAGIGDWFSSDKEKDKATAVQSPLEYKRQVNRPEVITEEQRAITYNNFYEFGTQKDDPVKNAQQFRTSPWEVEISGLAEQTGTFNLEDILSWFPLEERIYRMRCVEAWSMIIPWIGFPLRDLLSRFKPLAGAKYVAFETLYDPDQMPGQRSRWTGGGIRYPYVEGLRIDEAMHPLTLMTVGMYGKTIPPQNGAPLRLIVPWKYGFKGIKSIVKIHFTDREPPTTWNLSAPQEYGFYANVNPKVDHPRWSQGSERLITAGGLFSAKRVPTLPFNGYADEVAALYTGMDLTRYY